MVHRMASRLVLCLTLLTVTLVSQAGAKVAPLYEPPSMELEGNKPVASVYAAIIRACKDREWSAEKLAGKQVVRASFRKPGKVGTLYKAVVDIEYSGKRITIRYFDSRDLDYDAGAQLISRYYNKWVERLEKEIWKEVNR